MSPNLIRLATTFGLAIASYSFNAAAQNAQISFADLEGTWRGKGVILQITPEGAMMETRAGFTKCRYVVDADSGGDRHAVFLDNGSSRKCPISAVGIDMAGDQIRLSGVSQGTAVSLTKTKGLWREDRTYPTVKVKGVSLGEPFDRAKQLHDGALSFGPALSSRRVVRGARQLNGLYVQGETRYAGEYGDIDASEDTLGLYRVENDANTGIAAILRTWAPAPANAPTAANFIKALKEAYGSPSKLKGSGSLTILEWHFDYDGNPSSSSGCGVKPPKGAEAVKVAMLFNIINFPSSGRAALSENSQQVSVYPLANCGFVLGYNVRARDNGALARAEGFLFDHRAIGSAMWIEDKVRIEERIVRALSQAKAAQSGESKL